LITIQMAHAQENIEDTEDHLEQELVDDLTIGF